MPWCETCHKYLLPNNVPSDGACPNCGTSIEQGRLGMEMNEGTQPEAKIPWHFWLLLASLTIYLGYRFFQLVLLIF